MLSSSFIILPRSFFGIFENSQMVLFAVVSNLTCPLLVPLVPSDTTEVAFASLLVMRLTGPF